MMHFTVPAGWTVLADKGQVRKVMLAAGNEVAAVARAMIRQGDRSRPSRPGDPPNQKFGKLARSIKARAWRDGEGVSIRASEYYALFLSLGAKGGGGNTAEAGNFTKQKAVMDRITGRHRA